ncbi:hypothetical protein HYW21_09140 [Candidatus Woesearchaeota archaeon]|nr:hypothetical protein [Candidatus Woesearchaeota archaeon]
MKRFATLVVLALFIISIVPMALAQSLASMDANARNQYNTYKQRYQQGVAEYNKARSDYLKAKELLQKAKNAQNLEEAFTTAQEYGRKTLNRIHGHLEFLNKALELYGVADDPEEAALMAEVQKHLADTAEGSSLYQEIEAATTISDLVAVKNKVMNEWNDDKALLKWGVASVLNRKAGELVDKLNKVYAKLDEKLVKQETLKPSDPTLAEMRATMTTLRADLDAIEADYATAQAKYKNINNLPKASSDVLVVMKELKDINRDIRTFYATAQKLVKQYNSYTTTGGGTIGPKNGSTTAEGTGWIEASGEGTISVTGSTLTVVGGKVEVEGDGVLTVKGDDTLSVTIVDGFGNKTELAANHYQYTGAGSAMVTGSNLDVSLDGTVTKFYAKGTGEVNLDGTGTYKKGKGQTITFTGPVSVEIPAE